MTKTTLAALAITAALLATGTFAETPAESAEALIRAHHSEVISLRANGASVDEVRAHRVAYEVRLQPLVEALSADEQAALKDLVLELTAERWAN